MAETAEDDFEAAVNSKLKDIAERIINGQPPEPVTVRDMIDWYGAKRRGQHVVERIRADLAHFGLYTDPDFESAWIDSKVNFLSTTEARHGKFERAAGEAATEGDSYQSGEPDAAGQSPRSEWIAIDKSHKLSKLRAANQGVVSVAPNDKISLAITKMVLNDFSQLPVMQSERNVKGIITWKLIGMHLSQRRNGDEVKDAMASAEILPASSSIFDAITVIAKHDYVLVRDEHDKISGLVTATDMNEQFQNLSGPFLVLSEIENRLRNIIGERFSIEDLRKAQDPGDPKKVNSVSDLAFGAYVRLLENQQNWEKLSLNLDRRYFCEKMNEIREIRNEVMHFDTDGLEPEKTRALNDFLKALQSLTNKSAQSNTSSP